MNLSLYEYETCGYCLRVRRAIAALGIEDHVEMRDVLRELRRREELFEARGRGTVPVLRIEEDDGSVRWLGESREIIAWLEARFGER